MLLTSLMPFRRRQPGWRKSQRHSGVPARCAAAVERLEARTLLSAVGYRSELLTPIGPDGASISLDVDVDFRINALRMDEDAGLEVALVIDNPDPRQTYVVDLVAPDDSRTQIASQRFNDIDDAQAIIEVEPDLADLRGSTFGTWTFEVMLSPDMGMDGMGMDPMSDDDDDDESDDEDERDLGGIALAELRVTPRLTPPPLGSISGVVFEDFDGDGVHDDSEPGRGFVDVNSDGMFNGQERRFTVFADINGNGVFDADLDGDELTDDPEPSAEPDDSGNYEISGLVSPASYAVGLIPGDGTQTSVIGHDIPDGSGDPVRFTFASGDEVSELLPDSNGFRTGGQPLASGSGIGSQWQLSDDQQFAANHSHDFAAVFARILPGGHVEPPDAGSRGELLTPQIVLPMTDNPLSLEFQSFLSVDGNNPATLAGLLSVSVIEADGSVTRLTSPEFGIDTTGGFTDQSLDVSQFRGKTVQFEFTITIPEASGESDDDDDDGTSVKAWYLDDVAVTERDAPGTQIVHLNPAQRSQGHNFAVASGSRTVGGTVFSDLNGDGVRNPDEPGLPGQVIVFDRDNNGFDGSIQVFESTLQAAPDDGGMSEMDDSDMTGSLSVEIGDEVSGTLLGVQLQGQLRLRNPEVFAEIADSDFQISLSTPFGQIQALASVIAPPSHLFESGNPPFDAMLDILLPENFVTVLRTSPVNGTWSLTGPNGGEGPGLEEILSVALDADVESLTLRLTVAQAADTPTADRFVISDSTGAWQFNGLLPSDPTSFEIVTSPLAANGATSTVTFQTDPANVEFTDDAFRDFNFGVSFEDPEINTIPAPSGMGRPMELAFGDAGQRGAIDYLTDHDIFRLPDGTEGLVTLELMTGEGSLNALNAQLTVFTAGAGTERREVAFNDNALFLLFGRFDSRIQFNADPNEQYFVELSASDVGDPIPLSPRQTIGSYELFASLEPPLVEAGDNPQSADDIDGAGGSLIPRGTPAGRPVYEIGNVDFAGDRDVYRVVAPGDGVLRVELEDLNSGLAAQLSVFDVEGNLLFQQPAAGELPEPSSGLLPLPSFVSEVVDEQELFVQVSAVTTDDSTLFGAPTGQYLLSLELVAESETDVSVIEVPAGGRRINRSGRLDFEGDVDHFDVTVPDASSGFLEILLEPGQLSLLDGAFAVHRLDTGEKLVSSVDFENSAFLTLGVGSDQPLSGNDELRIFINGLESSRGDYDFSVRYVEEDRTGGMGASSPHEIRLDADLTGNVTSRIDFAGDQDFFEFTIPGMRDDLPVVAVVSVERIDSIGVPLDSSDVVLDVKPGPDNEFLPEEPENESDVTEEFVFIADPGTTYVADVGFLGTLSGRFNVFVELIDLGNADDFGNDAASATQLDLDDEEDGFLEGDIEGILQTPGDNDVFSFTPLNSGILGVEVELVGADSRIRPDDNFSLTITADPATPAIDAIVSSRGRGGGSGDEPGRVLETEFAVDAGRTYFFDVASSNATAFYELNLELLADTAFVTGDVVLNAESRGGFVEAAIDRPENVFSQLVQPQNNGRLTVFLDAEDGLIPELNVFVADANNAATGDALATKRALRRNEFLDVLVPTTAGQNLVVTVGAARPSDGEFALTFFLDRDVADDVPDDASETDPADDIQFAVDLETGELLPVTLERRIDFDADFDVFAFPADFTGRVGVELNAIGPNNFLDPELTVFEVTTAGDAPRETIEVNFDNPLQFDDNSGAGLNSTLDFPVVGGRTYFIEAAAANAVEGNYEITFRPITGDDFGNSLSSADRLLLNASGNLSRDRNGDGDSNDLSESNRTVYGFLTADDTDVFRFQSTVTRQLLISARGIIGDVVPELFVYEDTGSVRQIITNGSEEVVIDAVEGGNYFLQVDSQGVTSGLYQIGIQPVDITRNLRLVESSNQASGTADGNIERVGQADFYEFRVPFAGRVVVELIDNDDAQDVNPILTVLDSQRNEIGTNDNASENTSNSRLEFNVNTREMFIVRAGLAGNQTGKYQLNVTLLPDAGIGGDPGELIRDATALTFSTRPDGAQVAMTTVTLNPVTFGTTNDTDVFSFLASSSGRVNVTLDGTAGETADMVALRRVSGGADLLLASGTGDDLSFDVVRGETYAIRVTGRGTGILNAVLIPVVNGGASLTFLSDSVGNATTELLGQIFTQLVSAGGDFTAEELSEAVLAEFLAASGGQENLQQRFLLLYVDPVDFVLTNSTSGQQAGFTSDQGQLDQFGNTFYSGDAVTELLVVPQAESGRYSLELTGLGQDVRGGASLVSNAGVTSQTFQFDNLASGRVTTVGLDFQETERPAQIAQASDIEAPVPEFPVSVLMTALLGLAEREEAAVSAGTQFRDASRLFHGPFPPIDLPDLPRMLGDLVDDIRVLLPLDGLHWEIEPSDGTTDPESDWLLPAVAPGMNGLTEAMSRFGELFGELLLPVAETGNEENSDDNSADTENERLEAPQRSQPTPDADGNAAEETENSGEQTSNADNLESDQQRSQVESEEATETSASRS